MQRLGTGQIILLVVLAILLIFTGVWAVLVWNASAGVEIGKHGWIALGLGSFFSLLIGCGLMALMFFSSRSGHDEQADPFRRREPPETRGRLHQIVTVRLSQLGTNSGVARSVTELKAASELPRQRLPAMSENEFLEEGRHVSLLIQTPFPQFESDLL